MFVYIFKMITRLQRVLHNEHDPKKHEGPHGAGLRISWSAIGSI
jgi:hypothetical protein